jgi:hypothetical protein
VTIAELLRKHAVYLDDDCEGEILGRGEVADWALRKCLCGERIDGFDEYTAHLVQVFENAEYVTLLENSIEDARVEKLIAKHMPQVATLRAELADAQTETLKVLRATADAVIREKEVDSD